MATIKPSAADLRNPDYVPPMGDRIVLGLQHVLAMFVSNFTPAIIIGGAAGFDLAGLMLSFLFKCRCSLRVLRHYFRPLVLALLGRGFLLCRGPVLRLSL